MTAPAAFLPALGAALLLLGPAPVAPATPVALAATAPVAPAAPAAQDGPRLEQVFPADTLGVVLLDDLGDLRERWAASAFGRMLADPALSTLRERLLSAWRELGAAVQERTGVDVLGLLPSIRGQVGLALLAVVPRDDDNAFRPAFALVVEIGEEAEAFADAVDRLVDDLVEERGLVLKSAELLGGSIATIVDPEDEQAPELQYGVFSGTLVVVLADPQLAGAGQLEELVHALAGEGRSALADAPAWKESMTTPRSALRVFVDLGALVELGGGAAAFAESLAAPEDVGPLVEFLGLDDLGVLTTAADFGAAGVSSQGQFSFTADTGAIQQVLAAAVGEGEPRLLTLVPPQVEMAFAAAVDFGGAWDAIVAATMRHEPEAGRKLVESLAEAEETAGFHPRDDLLAGLDGQFAVLASKVEPGEAIPFLPSEGDPVNFLLMLGLRDGAAMRTLVDAAVRKQGAHAARQREEFEGYEIYAVPAMMPGMSVTYAVLDDLFVVSLAPSLVKDVLRRHLHADLPAVVTSKGFEATLATLPDGRQMLGYEPGRSQPESFLQVLELLQAASPSEIAPPGEGFGLDALPQELLDLLDGLELPAADLLEKYFERPSLTALAFDGRGLRWESAGP